MHSRRVFEFEPELAVEVSSLLGLKVVKFVITFDFLIDLGRVFFDSEDEVVFDDY